MSIKNQYTNARRPDTHLYTKGFQYSLDGKNYIGEYHLLNQEPYTEPTHTRTSQKLTKYYDDQDVYVYDKIKKFTNLVTDYIEPKPYILKSQQLDYNSGYVVRYFVEKAFGSDRYPIEIDYLQHQSYNKPKSINGGLYNRVKLNWKLTGPLNNVYTKSGMISQIGIYEHNALQVEYASKTIPNISYVIKNYIEFARPE
jgi:hypothetical protein